MLANFVCIIRNISGSLNYKGEIALENQDFFEVPTDRIEDISIPRDASAMILFKNEISGRESGMPIISEFKPQSVKQYVITTEPYLNLPALLSRFSISKPAADGVVGAYILRDGTLFLVNDEMKAAFQPILASSLSETGKILDRKTSVPTF